MHSEHFYSIKFQDSVHLKERITATIPTVTPNRRSQKSTTITLAFIIFHPFTVPKIISLGNNFMNIDKNFALKDPIRLKMLHF